VAYNFQIGKNKTKLLTKYESVTQNVILYIESVCIILNNIFQYLFQFLEWREGFLIPTFYSYDDLSYVIIIIYLLLLVGRYWVPRYLFKSLGIY
jgi:hypothetical protein